MSSRKPVSTARPQTFWSIEYGDFLRRRRSAGPCSSAKAIALSRVMPRVADRGEHLRSGRERADADLEAHLVVALAGAAVRDVDAPCSRAAATRCLTISGRDSAETSG